jgi:hypothetical protein
MKEWDLYQTTNSKNYETIKLLIKIRMAKEKEIIEVSTSSDYGEGSSLA